MRIYFNHLLNDAFEFWSCHLFDLIGDENESIEWFQRVMLELAGWVGDKEKAREILRRFKKEWEKSREEKMRFERDALPGLPNPYPGKRFRRFNL